MKRYEISWKSLRAAGLCLLAAGALAACDSEEFVRDAGTMPASPDGTPVGALYAQGGFVSDAQDFSISENTNAEVVYRLNLPAKEDVTITLAVGTQEDVDAYNDAKGLQDIDGNLGGFKRYRLLPETNYTLPETMTLTVPKGKTESAPLSVGLIYDENLLTSYDKRRMLHPWMLPLQVKSVQGGVLPLIADQVFLVGVRPGNQPDTKDMNGDPAEWQYPEEKGFGKFITFADCREMDPSYIIYYGCTTMMYEYVDMGGFGWVDVNPEYTKCYTMFDVGCLRPAFIAYNADMQCASLEIDVDLMYPLTHQGRYLDPLRDRHIKVCVSVESKAKSVVGLCNLDDENRALLVWQIANMVEKYGLDGVALNDAGVDYASEKAPAVDKASYTKFLKALREALGGDKLILLSYDADENSALYEEHDGLRAGDYIDYAWWGTENEFCTPYADVPTVQPIAGLPVSRFCPMAGNAVDTPEYAKMWTEMDDFGWPLAVSKGKELHLQGQFPIGVYLGIRPYTQNFCEWNMRIIPETMPTAFLLETDFDQIPGGIAMGLAGQDQLSTGPWGQGSYGAGLKDW